MSDGHINWVRAMDPRATKLNILLLALPATCYYAYVEHNESMAFFSSLVAIMPLAFLMGRATEEIALRTSESLGGLLNATFGNAAEMIIAFLAIYAASQADLTTAVGTATESTMIHLVQASLIGSILGNLLLVMGLAFVWGGARLGRERPVRGCARQPRQHSTGPQHVGRGASHARRVRRPRR